ncbi:MAG: hypothetical protein WC058_08525 [Phycisphaeraceae bacterium]
MLVSVAAWIVIPHQSERWESVDPKAPDAAMVERVLVIERRIGFRIAGRGLSHITTAHIPQLKSHSPLSAQAFDLLSSHLRTYVVDCDFELDWSDVWEHLVRSKGYDTLGEHCYFEVITADPKLVSILESDVAQVGHARGDCCPIGRNFVWDNGSAASLELKDLFEPGTPWSNALENAVREDANRRTSGNEWPMLNFHIVAFTIRPESIQVYFAGMITWPGGVRMVTDVPWAKLRAYMKADSPVTRWVDERVEASRPPESVSPR